MGTSTADKQSQKELTAKHKAAIAAYDEESRLAAEAKEKGDKKEAESHNAKKSNRSREIRQIELDMATEGMEFKEWDKPKTSRSGSSTPPVTQEQLETDLARMALVVTGDFPKSTQATANQRIDALLKQADRHGYKVTDPRG